MTAVLFHDTPYRVCYADVDRMGYVYHGHYLRLFEIGRNEMIRSLFGSYRDLEDSGWMLPCRHAELEFLRPALFDQLLVIRTLLDEAPRLRFRIRGEIYAEGGELVARSLVTLIFADTRTGRPRRAPRALVERLEERLREAAGKDVGPPAWPAGADRPNEGAS